MLDTHARKYVSPFIELGADFFIKLKFSANNVTLLAFFLGVLTSVFIFFDKITLAFIVLWISGYLDAVDGEISRKTKTSSSFGTLLDIVCDRLVEISMILALGIKYEFIRLDLIFLSCSILISMTIFLTVGALSEKKGMKSFYYQAGVTERTEGFIFFSIMFLFPNYLTLSTRIFTFLILFTALQRFLEAKKLFG